MLRGHVVLWQTREVRLDQRVLKSDVASLGTVGIQTHVLCAVEDLILDDRNIGVALAVPVEVNLVKEAVHSSVCTALIAGIVGFRVEVAKELLQHGSSARRDDLAVEPVAHAIGAAECVRDQPVRLLLEAPAGEVLGDGQGGVEVVLFPSLGRCFGILFHIANVELPELHLLDNIVLHVVDNPLKIALIRKVGRQTSGGQGSRVFQEVGVHFVGCPQVGSSLEVVSSVRVVLQPLAVVRGVVPDHVGHGQKAVIFLHLGRQGSDVSLAVGEVGRIKGQLVVERVWRVAVTANHKRGVVHHVVPTSADAVQVTLPVFRVLAHELGQDRDDRDCVQRYLRLATVEVGGDVNVVGLGAGGFGLLGWSSGELGQRSVGGVKLKGTRLIHRTINLDDIVEVGLKPERVVSILVRIGLEPLATDLYSLKCLRSNFSPLPGRFTQRLPLRQMELVPSISKRTE